MCNNLVSQLDQFLEVTWKVFVGISCESRLEIEQIYKFESFLGKINWKQVSAAGKVDNVWIQVKQLACHIHQIASKRNQLQF